MSTRVSPLNSTVTDWNDSDLTLFHRDHIGSLGAGVLKIDRVLKSLENKGFELMTGSITAAGWIGSNTSSWYGTPDGATAVLSFATDKQNSGSNSLKIACTVNNGSQKPQARLSVASGSYSGGDFYKLLKIKPNTLYEISGYIEVSGVSAGASGGASLRAITVDSAGVTVDAEQGTTLLTGTATFAKQTLQFTSGATAEYLQLFPALLNETGDAWFDDLEVKEVGDDMRVVEETIPTNTVKVKTGISYIQITKNSTVYAPRFETTAEESIAIPANSSGNPRKDIIIAKVDTTTDPNATSSNIGTLVVVQGTAAPAPVEPAIPANSIKLATVDVANGQTVFTNSDITDGREALRIQSIALESPAGSTDLVNMEEVKKPSTIASRGSVKLSEEPLDPENPVAMSETDARILTAAQKTQLLGSLDAGNQFTLPAGENIDTSLQPKVAYLDPTNQKVKVVDGSNDTHVANYIGHVISSGNGDTALVGFDAADDNDYYSGASISDHPTLNTTPTALKTAFTLSNQAALAASNDTDAAVNSSVNFEFAYQLLDYDVSKTGFAASTIHLMELLVESTAGGATLTDGWDMYIWDETNLQWVLAGSSTVAFGTDEAVESKTLALRNEEVVKYLDGSDHLFVLIKSKDTSDGSNSINVQTDFTSLTVSQGVNVQKGGIVQGYSDLVEGKWYHPAIAGSYVSKTIFINSNQTSINNIGLSVDAIASSLGNDDFWSGELNQFTIRLSKVNAGQDVYGYIVQGKEGDLLINGGDAAQLTNGYKVIHNFKILASSISTSMGDHVVTVNKYLPKGKWWLVLSTSSQPNNGSNYINLQTSNIGASTGGHNFGTSWSTVNSLNRIYMIATQGVDYVADVDRSLGDVARTNNSNIALPVGRAISENELLVIQPERLHFQDNTGNFMSGAANFAFDTLLASPNYLEFATGFKPRKVRVIGRFQDNTTTDPQSVVFEAIFTIDKKANIWSSIYYLGSTSNQNNPSGGDDAARVFPNALAVLFLDDSFVLNHSVVGSTASYFAVVGSVEAWS